MMMGGSSIRIKQSIERSKKALVPAKGFLVVISGLPGVGKSTAARALSPKIGAPILEWDWVMAVLKRHGLLEGLSYDAYLEAGYDILATVARRQLEFGLSPIVDAVLLPAGREILGHIVEDAGFRIFVFELTCEQQLHRGRVEGRQRGIPGWGEVDWDHVQTMRRRVGSPEGSVIRVDTSGTPASVVAKMLEEIKLA